MDTMPKYVWIVCGGALQVPAVEAAHVLGLRTIVSDRNPDAPAMQLADIRIVVDIYDVEGHKAEAKKLTNAGASIVGVFTEGADCEVTVAELARYLGLPGIDPEAAYNCKNKVNTNRALYFRGISKTHFIHIVGTGHLKNAEEFARHFGFPVMVKAVDNCASRGTRRVGHRQDLPIALAEAMAASTTGTALIEEYLEGPQQSIEILFDADGINRYLNTVDRYFDGQMELWHVNPTRLDKGQLRALYALTRYAARAVGVNFGAFKADTILTKDGPRILEVTARLSGGYDCQYTTPLSSGRDFIRAAMALACGMPIPADCLTPTLHRYAAAWSAFPNPGRVVSIDMDGIEKLGAKVFLRVKPGDVIEPYQNCAQRPGFVISTSDTYDGALEAAQRGAALLAERIRTE